MIGRYEMKKILLAALAAGSASIAMPAAAQVTGTVDVTGTVTGRCSVVPAGSGGAGAFSGTIDLNTLDESDGTLRADLESSSSAAPADAQRVTTRVVCNTAAPTVAISATAMQISGGTLDGTAGYADTINYTAQVEVQLVGGGSEFRRVNTLSGSVAPGDSGALGARILNTAGGAANVDVSVYDLHAEGSDSNILAAGTYNGVITVSIQPGA